MEHTLILAMDTSCDDTAVAVLDGERVLSNIVSSQIDVHKEWGGVVPRLARREHEKMIDGCIELALKRAKKTWSDISAVAVTYGPGLAPALEVGVKKAQALSLEYTLPLIAVDHMEGHALSVFLKNKHGKTYSGVTEMSFPFFSVCVSGGHTEIVLVKALGEYEIIGQTLDDAAGEAFDKVGRMLSLGYPAGPVIAKLAEEGNPESYKIPRPMQHSKDFNFSFSGLKTSCLYEINTLKEELGDQFAKIIPDYCASVQEAIVDSLLIKVKKAAKKYSPKMIVFGGGVSANNRLRIMFRAFSKQAEIPVYFPNKKISTDNAAMIALAAYYKFGRGEFVKDVPGFDRNPSLRIDQKEVL